MAVAVAELGIVAAGVAAMRAAPQGGGMMVDADCAAGVGIRSVRGLKGR